MKGISIFDIESGKYKHVVYGMLVPKARRTIFALKPILLYHKIKVRPSRITNRKLYTKIFNQLFKKKKT